MPYFPFFVDLRGKKGLIVGGGNVALRKAEKLAPYGAHLTAAAPEICTALRALPGLTFLERPFEERMIEGCFFVIAATDDREENRRIASLCAARGIFVNAVDDRAACSFLFPALVQRGELSIGISTGGASPSAAKALKNDIEALLPENMEELLAFLDSVRPAVKAAIAEENGRAACFAALHAAVMRSGRTLTQEEVSSLLARFSKEKGERA